MNSILEKLTKCSKHLEATGQVLPDTYEFLKQYERVLASKELETVKNVLEKGLDLQDLSNKIDAIKACCVGDGCGLKTGTYVDDLITAFFKKNLVSYREYHKGEADLKICDVPLSLKTCTNEKGTQFALNWSKNETKSDPTLDFDTHIMILVSRGGQWWKQKEGFNRYIKSGIYLIDRYYCKDNIDLTANNKTDKLISKKEVYHMIQYSQHYVEMPPPQPDRPSFDILKAF